MLNYTICFTVIPPQQIHIFPIFANIYLAQIAKFCCSATGYNLSYQWTVEKGFFPNKVTGINSNTLVIPDVELSDDNNYTCMAFNEGGSLSSNIAQLKVIGMYDYAQLRT